MFFHCILCNNEHENTKKLNKITKEKANTNKFITISNIIYQLLLFLFLYRFEELYEGKQVARYLKNPKYSTIMPQLWLNHIDIICGDGLGCENEIIDHGRSYVDKNINISLCFFSRYLLFSGEGGVIYVLGDSYSMNVNYSMFYNCVCSNYGGAIYFFSTNSCLRMICANSCTASSYGHFSYLISSLMNQVEYLSVSNCSHARSGYFSYYLQSGNQRVDNTNSSKNNAIHVSSIGINSPSSFTSSHCTFSNNNVYSGICIKFYSESGSISYANIVHNNSPSLKGVITVSGEGSRNMRYCIFQNNQNYLFCVVQGSLEVSHSFIDHSSFSFSKSTSVSTTNNSFTNMMTYRLQFFNSLHCNTDIPETTGRQSQDVSTIPFIWITYSVVVILFFTMLACLYFYKGMATNLLERHELENRLQIDFG